MRARALVAVAAALAADCGEGPTARPRLTGPLPFAWATFHGDAARTGWNDRETELTPSSIRRGFGPLWASDAFDPAVVDGVAHAPHAYASPLYVEGVRVSAERAVDLVIVATSSGYVYAVSAFDHEGTSAGEVVWRRRLTNPALAPRLDGGVAVGVLSTPVIDLRRDPPALYVTSADAHAGWQLFGLDLATGAVIGGFPVTLDAGTLRANNANGPARMGPATEVSQRGALALSPDGAVVYVPFGTYWSSGPGWIVAVATDPPRVLRAFSVAPEERALSAGGVWGAGGASVDASGRVYVTTGNGPADRGEAPRTWSSSLLRFGGGLAFEAAWSPFDHCRLDAYNMDLAASSPLLVPDLDPSGTSTPRLAVFGGKQGLVYLVDRDRLARAPTARQPCTMDPSRDTSLLPPEAQPFWGSRGPLLVFGPYSADNAQQDAARMRTTPAYLRDGASHFLFVTGSPKRSEAEVTSVAPGIVRLRLVTEPGRPAWLALDGSGDVVLQNPGSPVVSSNHGRDAVVWVLDSNQLRTAPLIGPDAARPVLYAFDARTLELLWRTSPAELEPGGKYNEALVVRGRAFVATDRLRAFGPTSM